MLLVSDVYQLLIDSLRVDERGLNVEVEEYNRWIRLVNQEIYDEYLRDFEEGIDSTDDLAFLKVHSYEIPLTAQASRGIAYGTMPSDYYQIIGKPWTLSGTSRRPVDIVTEFEDGSREDDFLTMATTLYPTCRVGGVNGAGDIQIKVRPQTITSIYLSYLKTVAVPYLDYYLSDTTGIKTFLPESAVAQSLPLGYTYRTGTIGGVGVTVTSLTRDFTWGEGDLGLILAKLLQKVGAALPDKGIQESSLAEEIKLQQ